MSACRDDQTAADTGHSGAFSDAMLATFEPHGSTSDWIGRAFDELRKGGYDQQPVASGAVLDLGEFFG